MPLQMCISGCMVAFFSWVASVTNYFDVRDTGFWPIPIWLRCMVKPHWRQLFMWCHMKLHVQKVTKVCTNMIWTNRFLCIFDIFVLIDRYFLEPNFCCLGSAAFSAPYLSVVPSQLHKSEGVRPGCGNPFTICRFPQFCACQHLMKHDIKIQKSMQINLEDCQISVLLPRICRICESIGSLCWANSNTFIYIFCIQKDSKTATAWSQAFRWMTWIRRKVNDFLPQLVQVRAWAAQCHPASWCHSAVGVAISSIHGAW